MVSLHTLIPATEVAAVVGKWKMEVHESFCFLRYGWSGFPRFGGIALEKFSTQRARECSKSLVLFKNELLTAHLRCR